MGFFYAATVTGLAGMSSEAAQAPSDSLAFPTQRERLRAVD
jgi:hypothetical protein